MTVTPLEFHAHAGLWTLGDKLFVVPKVPAQAAAELPMHLRNKDEVVVFEGTIVEKFFVERPADKTAGPFVRKCFPDGLKFHYCITVPPYNDSLPNWTLAFPIPITMAALRNDFDHLVKATTILETHKNEEAAYDAAVASESKPDQGFWIVEVTSIAGRSGHPTYLTIAVVGNSQS